MADVYIFLGPEEGEKKEAIAKIKRDVLTKYPDSEVYSFFVGDDEEGSYISAVSQPSLFSSHRFIVFKNFENIKKSDETYKATIEAVKSNSDDLTLIIVSSESNKNSIDNALLSASGDNTKIFWELKDEDKKAWISNKVRKEGFQITKDAVEEILSTVENNTEEMKNLVLSITSFLRLKDEKRTIDRDDIELYATRTKGESGYTLFKALGEANLEKALTIVDTIILNDSRDIISALSIVASQFRRIESALKMKKEGKRDDVIYKELTSFSLYSSSKARIGVNFKEKELFRVTMKNYTLEDVRRIIILLGNYDNVVKATSTDNLLLTVEFLVYLIIVNKGRESNLSLNALDLLKSPF